jgi:threonine/homoserine/homoserine lactone efflux protein
VAELLGIILNGVGLGLALSILLGPVFFALIHTSISKGFREGFIMAIGIVVSDATYLTIAFSLANLVDQPFVKKYLGYAGALLLLFYGIYLLISKYQNLSSNDTNEKRKIWKGPFFKGFMLNLINVNVFFFWLFAISTVQGACDSSYEVILFFSGTLGTVFLTDIGKAYLAKQLQRWITEARINLLNKIVGAVLFVFGIIMMYQVYLGKNVLDNKSLEQQINSSVNPEE